MTTTSFKGGDSLNTAIDHWYSASSNKVGKVLPPLGGWREQKHADVEGKKAALWLCETEKCLFQAQNIISRDQNELKWKMRGSFVPFGLICLCYSHSETKNIDEGALKLTPLLYFSMTDWCIMHMKQRVDRNWNRQELPILKLHFQCWFIRYNVT